MRSRASLCSSSAAARTRLSSSKNAIFTASARHLARLEKYKTPDGILYQGKYLTNLTNETALHYHDMCLKELVMVKDDEKHIYDENLLAAAIILRFYEEVDGDPSSSMPPQQFEADLF